MTQALSVQEAVDSLICGWSLETHTPMSSHALDRLEELLVAEIILQRAAAAKRVLDKCKEAIGDGEVFMVDITGRSTDCGCPDKLQELDLT